MGSGGKARWKLSSLYHRSPAVTPSRAPPPAPDPPVEFVCPISGRLMADPVILPSGRTFERACVQACHRLGVATPGAAAHADDELLLIPNMALKAAIHNWCDSLGLDRPRPLDQGPALHLVRALSGSSPSTSSPASSYFTTTTMAATFTSWSSSEAVSSCYSHCPPRKSAAYSGTGLPALALEEEILAGLGEPQASAQEAALLLLRSATRDGGDDARAALCTPRILDALRPALLSRHRSLQSHAAASLLNLSLHPPNRTRIVRAGTVPALIEALRGGCTEARDHAAGALFSLAIDDDNKAAVGALGALPSLLHLMARRSVGERARRDAAMALYHLSMAGANRTKLVKLGAVRTLLRLATRPQQETPATMQALSLMVLCNLAASGEARDAMMEAGAVEALVGLLREAPPDPGRRDPAAEARREHCVAALYWMSRGSMRFRGLARAARAEEVLMAVVEQEATSAAADGKRRRTREMAKRALRAVGAADAAGGVSDSALRALRPANVMRCELRQLLGVVL